MRLRVNGEEHQHAGGGTVQELLAEIGAEGNRVAVMVNDAIVPKAEFGRVRLREGDRVEVLAFMGGG